MHLRWNLERRDVLDRKICFSREAKSKFSDTEREKLAGEFSKHFKRTGQRFIEKRSDDGEVLICNVTQKLFQIMFEFEW